MKSMKRVDIKARLFFKGQGPKMLTGYYEYWRKHDTLFKMCYFGVVFCHPCAENFPCVLTEITNLRLPVSWI